MEQIDRFRARMKNVSKSATEYRMTISEARGLLDEITNLEKMLAEKPSVDTVVQREPVIVTRILDGGTF